MSAAARARVADRADRSSRLLFPPTSSSLMGRILLAIRTFGRKANGRGDGERLADSDAVVGDRDAVDARGARRRSARVCPTTEETMSPISVLLLCVRLNSL
jgi:hypothetical protein